jgi:hypothetical protein
MSNFKLVTKEVDTYTIILPQHTQILIKDLDFQATYHLSHTQMDVMAYMVNVPYRETHEEMVFELKNSQDVLLV